MHHRLILSVLFLFLCGSYPQLTAESFSSDMVTPPSRSSEAVLYYSPSCGHCKQVKAYLNKVGKTVAMKNVGNPKYQQELMSLGQRGVPVLVVNGQVIAGSGQIISYLSSHPEVLR